MGKSTSIVGPICGKQLWPWGVGDFFFTPSFEIGLMFPFVTIVVLCVYTSIMLAYPMKAISNFMTYIAKKGSYKLCQDTQSD